LKQGDERLRLNNEVDKFSRQRGLIRQDVLEQIKVEFVNDDLIPPVFLSTMKKISQQLGIRTFPFKGSSEHPTFKIRWLHQEANIEEFDVFTIPVHYGKDGVFLNGEISKDECHAFYEQSLATLASCLAWSEIIRRSKAYQPVEIPKVTVSVNVRVNENSLYRNVNQLKFALENHSFSKNVKDTNDGTSHRRVSLRLDEQDPLVKELLSKLQVDCIDDTIEPKNPVIRMTLPDVKSPLQGHVTIVGAGGLGTWCLFNLVGGLKRSSDSNVNFLIFDKDLEIERHNLNRQVIYSEEDIGQTKISATRAWLRKKLPQSNIDIALELTDLMAQREFSQSDDGVDFDDLFPLDQDLKHHPQSHLETEDVISKLDCTNVIVGCLDAMRPRVLANYIAADRGVPYVNGGVSGFHSQFQLFSSSNLVEMYGEKIATDTTVSSCQEDGEVPLSSMVLTNAFSGAFQAISIGQLLNKNHADFVFSSYWNAYHNDVHLDIVKHIRREHTSLARVREALWGQN
jgi:molybdopterin/thiamine biosynthesis adenylyltransferase